jgi:DNA-binding PadR family transcriptional regulator
MTKNELVVLGLLSEKPMYGYQLHQEIERTEMEHWAQVNLASMYNTLNRLQKEKLIEGKEEKPGKMPERKVYHITPKGEKRLGELVEMALNEKKMPEDSFMVGVAFLQGLAREKVLSSLAQKKRQLHKVIKKIQGLCGNNCEEIPFNLEFILERGISHLKLDIKLIDKLANQVRNLKLKGNKERR